LVSRRSASDRLADARRNFAGSARAANCKKSFLFSREAKPERRAVNLNEVIERTVALRSYELKIENISWNSFDPACHKLYRCRPVAAGWCST